MKNKIKYILIILALVLAVPIFAESTASFIDNTGTYLKKAIDPVLNALTDGGTCNPQGAAPGTGGPWLGFTSSAWLVPIVLILFILLMVFILVYLVGIFLQSPNLISTAKEEFFQIGISALRLGFIIGIMLAASQWYNINGRPNDPVYKAAPTYIDASIIFSEHLVKDIATNFSLLLTYNMVVHTLFSATMWFGVTWRAMFSFNLGPILKPLIDLLGFSMQFLSVSIGEWIVHTTVLCLLKKWTFTIFVPLGLLMRSISFLRGAGDAFLALVFSFSLFYPFMFIVDYEVYKLMGCNVLGAFSGFFSENHPDKAFYCGPGDPTSINSNFAGRSGGAGIFGSLAIIALLMGGVFVPFMLTGALNLAFELVKSSVFFIVIMSLILPFINIFITLTSAKETAKFFNVDINFFAFVKLI